MDWRAPAVAAALYLTAAHNAAAAERVALTLAHKKEQLDIPASAIRRVKARSTLAFTVPGTRQRVVRKEPHVEACFTRAARDRICAFTKRVVNEKLVILIGCTPMAEPVVREPICVQSCLRIAVLDMEEAEDLAHFLREGSTVPCVGPYRDARGASSGPLAFHEAADAPTTRDQ